MALHPAVDAETRDVDLEVDHRQRCTCELLGRRASSSAVSRGRTAPKRPGSRGVHRDTIHLPKCRTHRPTVHDLMVMYWPRFSIPPINADGCRRVDLMGRLSNPRPIVDTLAEQGSAGPQRPLRGLGDARNRASERSSGGVPEEEGRLSNPVQRRLSELDIDALVQDYLAGSSIDSLAARLSVNRTTIISHLDRRDIERRRVVRKMTDQSVRQAARHYDAGASLTAVASLVGVDTRTLAREFRRAGVDIRPRRGWPPPSQS